MKFEPGQVLTGNDGKVRKILEVFNNYQGKEGEFITWIEVKNGKLFGKKHHTSTLKPPNWAGGN